MNFLYHKQMAALLVTAAFATTACGQHAKVKTITIVNGDTTISESNMDEKDLAKFEKQISITVDDDDKSDKKIVKKIIINGDEKDMKDAEAMAYSFSTGDGEAQDVEVSTGKDGETKVIIKKGGKEKGEGKEEKTIVRKSMSITSDDAKTEKENLNVNINIKNTTAKVDVETGSKEPINISILDETGKQVFYDSQKTGGKYSKEIPLGKKGTYFMNIIQNKKSSTEKIVIE